MAGIIAFLFIVVVIVICIALFGSADSKKLLLNEVGLDLSKNSYETQKENEFIKNCKKAMKVAINDYKASGSDELDFLRRLYDILWKAEDHRRSFSEDWDSSPTYYNLLVKSHYIKFSHEVVNRRIKDLKDGKAETLLNGVDYSNKDHLLKYIDKLWNKYQYPWPEDWKKEDSFLS